MGVLLVSGGVCSKNISKKHKSRVKVYEPRISEANFFRCTFAAIRFAPHCLYWFPHPLDLQQSGSEFAGGMRFVVLLVCLLHQTVNAQSDPLAVIGAILDSVGIEYVPPPARPGTCRDCSRSQLARFGIGIDIGIGIDLTPTLPTNPCCTTTTAAPATTTTTTTTTTTAPTCTCGQEGTTRIVGGEESMVRNLFYCSRSKRNTSGRKIPMDHGCEFWVD